VIQERPSKRSQAIQRSGLTTRRKKNSSASSSNPSKGDKKRESNSLKKVHPVLRKGSEIGIGRVEPRREGKAEGKNPLAEKLVSVSAGSSRLDMIPCCLEERHGGQGKRTVLGPNAQGIR